MKILATSGTVLVNFPEGSITIPHGESRDIPSDFSVTQSQMDGWPEAGIEILPEEIEADPGALQEVVPVALDPEPDELVIFEVTTVDALEEKTFEEAPTDDETAL